MGELVLFERLKKREYSVFLDDVPVFYKENLRDAITSFSPHSTAFCPFSEQFGFMLLRSRQALYCTRLALKYSSRSFQNSPGLLPSFGWLLVNTTKIVSASIFCYITIIIFFVRCGACPTS